jgi:ABC-type antimicrobial peptide transport system permease subunit
MDELPRVWREIVGIAADVRQRNLEEDPRPVFYRPYSQGFDDELTFAVRIVPGVAMSQAARALEDAVTKSDTRVPWEQVKSMQQIIYDSESLSLRRPVVRLLGAFGFLALLLTVAGLFAVLSYSVSARTREIGIRMAIGARQIQILRQIIAETLSFIFVGALIGSIGAYVLSQALPTGHIGWSGSGIFLYGVNRLDVLTYGTVLVSLCLISLSAGLLPARKAMSIDPAIALRDE